MTGAVVAGRDAVVPSSCILTQHHAGFFYHLSQALDAIPGAPKKPTFMDNWLRRN